MEKLHRSIFINAPREKVWEAMLGDATYRDWTSAFHPGSYFKGDWSQGSKILFLGPGENGEEGGMVSRIKESRPHEYMSIEHLGMINNGVEDTTSEATKGWAGATENYTFIEKDGGTELVIDMDIQEAEKATMEAAWDKGLETLKSIAEA